MIVLPIRSIPVKFDTSAKREKCGSNILRMDPTEQVLSQLVVPNGQQVSEKIIVT